MAIYDNDGTADYEIGKLYDNDGTTDYQIGKVYDNDGTTDWLIYTAAEPITVIPNASKYPASAYTVRRVDGNNATTTNAHAVDNTSMSVGSSSATFNLAARENGGWTCYYVPVVVDGLTKLTIKGTITSASKNGTVYVGLFSSTDNVKINSMITGYSKVLNESAHTINNTYTFTETTGTKYLIVAVYGSGTSSRAWGYVTLTALSLTE